MDSINDNLKLFLETKLNKPFDLFDEEDFKKIDTLILTGENNKCILNLDILKYFKNLNSLTIKSALITPKDIEIIADNRNILVLSFNHCTFLDEQYLKKLNCLKSLTFYNCCLESYGFLNEYQGLENFVIDNPYDETPIDLLVLKNNSNLTRLVLDKTFVYSISNIKYLNKLTYLSLLDSIIKDDNLIKSSLDNLPNLKNLYISSQYLNDDFDDVNYHIETSLILNATVEDISKKI